VDVVRVVMWFHILLCYRNLSNVTLEAREKSGRASYGFGYKRKEFKKALHWSF
jgi:hypothetical protein